MDFASFAMFLFQKQKLVSSILLLVRMAAGIFAVIFIGGAIGFVLFVAQGNYEGNTLFLATCAVVSSVVCYIGDRLGWILDSLADSTERI